MKKSVIILFISALFLAGCSSSGEKNLTHSTQKVSKTESAFKTLDEGLDDIVNEANAKITSSEKVRIGGIEFTSIGEKNQNLERMIAEELTTKLFAAEKFQIIERAQLNKIMEEQKLAVSGMANQESSIQTGKLESLDALFTGTISELENSIKINVKLVSVQTGAIISVASTEVDKNSIGIDNSPFTEKLDTKDNEDDDQIKQDNPTKGFSETDKNLILESIKKTDQLRSYSQKNEPLNPMMTKAVLHQRLAKQMFNKGLGKKASAHTLLARELIYNGLKVKPEFPFNEIESIKLKKLNADNLDKELKRSIK